jgi:hypothetical protein
MNVTREKTIFLRNEKIRIRGISALTSQRSVAAGARLERLEEDCLLRRGGRWRGRVTSPTSSRAFTMPLARAASRPRASKSIGGQSKRRGNSWIRQGCQLAFLAYFVA